MNNRIDKTLKQAREIDKTVIVPYITVGFPEIDTFKDIASVLVEAGVDMLELGIPFSDPLADGPTIQATSFKALENGVNLSSSLEAVSDLRVLDDKTPIIFMGYYNPFFKYGIKKFLKDASVIGVDGLIIPDLPSEESMTLSEECKNVGIHLIPLLAPTSTEQRIEAACSIARGFIYCVSLTGVTGARAGLSANVKRLVDNIRKYTDLPILVGFGVSTKKDVIQIGKFADGAVVGSALLDVIKRSPKESQKENARMFVKNLMPSGS